MGTMSIEVHKFGGSSLAETDRIRRAATLVAARDASCVVVASAMGGALLENC